jgi:hypothetical protein
MMARELVAYIPPAHPLMTWSAYALYIMIWLLFLPRYTREPFPN